MSSPSKAVVSRPFSYEIITSTKQAPLKLVEKTEVKVDGKKVLWKDQPLRINTLEKASMNYGHVQWMLGAGGETRPSSGAGIPEKELCACAKLIDSSFNSAIESYQNSFKISFTKDIQAYKRAKSHWKILFQNFKPKWFGKMLSVVVAPVLSNFHPDKNAKLREGSHHRILWLKEVDTKEKTRLTEAKNIITLRCETLYIDLEEMREENFTNASILKELLQLDKLHKYLFPYEARLTIGGMLVANYLKQIKNS